MIRIDLESITPTEAVRLNWSNIGKFLVHGIAFAILFFVGILVWRVIQVTLVGLGFIIGLAVGFCLLFLAIGFLNSVITTYLWFEVRNGFWGVLAHGVSLFIMLLVVNGVIITIPNLAFPGLTTSAITFVIGAFVDGLLAKRVAAYWKQESRASPTW